MKFQNWEKSGKRMSSHDVQIFSHFFILFRRFDHTVVGQRDWSISCQTTMRHIKFLLHHLSEHLFYTDYLALPPQDSNFHHRFPAFGNPSPLRAKTKFYQHRNCVTNSILNKKTRIRMDIVDCEELALNLGYERIWFSRIRVKF